MVRLLMRRKSENDEMMVVAVVALHRGLVL